jgi:hypothetical protein
MRTSPRACLTSVCAAPAGHVHEIHVLSFKCSHIVEADYFPSILFLHPASLVRSAQRQRGAKNSMASDLVAVIWQYTWVRWQYYKQLQCAIFPILRLGVGLVIIVATRRRQRPSRSFRGLSTYEHGYTCSHCSVVAIPM